MTTKFLNGIDVDGSVPFRLQIYTEANRASIARPAAEAVMWVSSDATAAPTNAVTSTDVVAYPS